MRRARTLLFRILLGVSCTLALLILVPGMFGYRTYTVLSGSMRPAIAPGDVVVTDTVSPLHVHPRNVVAFTAPGGTRLVTHRVQSVHERDGGVEIVTKGDANATAERWSVPDDRAVQRVVMRIPKLGYAGAWVRTPLGVLLLVVPVLWLVASRLLRMRRREDSRRRLQTLFTLGALGLAGMSPMAGVFAAFTATVSNTSNSLAAADDWTAPTITRAVIERTDTDKGAGYVKQGGNYYIYAQITDTGNPASGVSTATADVDNVTAGQTAVALTTAGGPWTINGLAYNYRSASKTADNPLSEGAKSYSVTAVDGAANSATNSSLSVTVDNTAPPISRSVIEVTGGGGPGTVYPDDTYYVYAESADASSGIDTVTANVDNVTAGQTAVALSTAGGPWTVGGQSYNYRSASKTVDSGLSAGSKSYSVTATDNVTNSTTDSSFTVTVASHDTDPPTIDHAVIERTAGSGAGYLAQNQAYYIYAEVTDDSGVASVTADVSTVTAGETAGRAVDQRRPVDDRRGLVRLPKCVEDQRQPVGGGREEL